MEYAVKMLDLESGKCPFGDWYRTIRDPATRARIRTRIARVRSGNTGDSKSVGEGVSELRLDFGPGYRIYFAIFEQIVVVLLAGGDKSSQERDILYARRLWREYQDAPERFQRDF